MNKRLYRSRENQVIGGVAAGIADYFAIDPVLVRVGFVVLTLIQGAGMLLYILLWIFVPEEPLPGGEKGQSAIAHEEKATKEEKKDAGKSIARRLGAQNDRGGITGALVLIAIGSIFLVENFLPTIHFGRLWPLILIAIGLGMVWNSTNRK